MAPARAIGGTSGKMASTVNDQASIDFLSTLSVGQAMTPRPATAHPREFLRSAWDRMSRGPFRHLPVLDDSRLVGIVTLWDICQGLALAAPMSEGLHPLDSIRVQAVMTRDPVVVTRDDALAMAAALLAERQIGALPVVDETSKLIGIVTERDVVREVSTALSLASETEEITLEAE